MSSHQAHLPLAALLVLAAACHAHYDDDCYDCGTQVYWESEPNDTAFTANGVGALAPGDRVVIHGHVTEWGPDLFDGFAFHTAYPADVELALWIDDPFADLDVCVYDPELGQYVFCFETANNPETGVFSIAASGKPFHLVVSSYHGASSYSLEVRGLSLSYPDSVAPDPQAATASPDAAPAHRPGREQHWRRYAAPEASAEPPQDPGRSARLISIDPQTGEVSSEPARLLPLGSR